MSLGLGIDTYVGLLYKSLGRDKNGIDCYGLVRLFYRDELGIKLPSLNGKYDDSENGDQTGAVVTSEIKSRWKKIDSPRYGDVVVFRMRHMATHIGVVLDDSTFLHALKGRNSCIERLTHILWRSRIYGYYRLRGEGEAV